MSRIPRRLSYLDPIPRILPIRPAMPKALPASFPSH